MVRRDRLGNAEPLRLPAGCRRTTGRSARLRAWRSRTDPGARMAEELQQERTRLANRLRQQLWRYYPQATKLTDDVADDWFLALWQKVPTPAAAAKVTEKTIAR